MPAIGELGLEGELFKLSGIAVGGFNWSNCLEKRLFPDAVVRLPEFGGRGDPDDEGV